MIVDKMNFNEVGEELLRFYDKNIERVITLLMHKNREYRRIILSKGEKRIDFKPISYENINQVYILPFSLGKKDFKKYGLSFYFIVKFYYQKKYWYAKIDCRHRKVEIYAYHFFQRYIERHLDGVGNVGIDIVRKYMIETVALTCIDKKEEIYEKSVYGTTSIGMCCGRYYDNINVWLTYIDKKTIKKVLKKKHMMEILIYSFQLDWMNLDMGYIRLHKCSIIA